MSYQKRKEKAIKLQEQKKKCCRYCSQLHPSDDGNYRCYFEKYKNESYGGGVVVNAPDIFRHRACFDKWNGLNLRTKEEYERSRSN